MRLGGWREGREGEGGRKEERKEEGGGRGRGDEAGRREGGGRGKKGRRRKGMTSHASLVSPSLPPLQVGQGARGRCCRFRTGVPALLRVQPTWCGTTE